MKFSHAEYPMLRMLDEGKMGSVGFFEEDHELAKSTVFAKWVSDNFKNQAPYIKDNINFLSKPFKLAIGESFDSLIRDDAWNNIDSQCGVLLNMCSPFNGISATYVIKNLNNSDGVHEYYILLMTKNIFIGAISQKDGVKSGNFSTFFFKQMHNMLSDNGAKLAFNLDSNEMANMAFTSLVSTLNFIKYAQVETKLLPPNSRTKDIGIKYVNQTNSKVRVLDSKWFTTLVKSDAFKVRGHFRLQPHKVGGEWTKKLIWINDFEKSGYTAPAQKLNVN